MKRSYAPSSFSDIQMWYQKGLRVEYLLEAATSVNWLQDSGVSSSDGAVEASNASLAGKSNSIPSLAKSGDSRGIHRNGLK